MAASHTKLHRLQRLFAVGIFCFIVGFMCSYLIFLVSEQPSANILSLENESLSISQPPPNELNNISYLVPEIPSLILLGPPKAGSRTFVNSLSKYDNVLQWRWERAFFCGANKIKCEPKYNETQWMQYIEHFKSDTKPLSYLVEVIQSHKHNARCTAEHNRKWYINRFNITKLNIEYPQNHFDVDCIHPKYALEHNIISTSSPHNYCYLIEKGPSQSRVPWVPIIYANLMPKSKTFIIIRNPVYHVMSCRMAFSVFKKGKKQTHKQLKQTTINKIKENEALSILNGICKDINNKWNDYDKKGIIGIKRYLLLKTEYKRFIATYLYRKFVDPRDIQKRGLRENIFLWAPFTFPVFIIALFAYDEVLGNTNWDKWTEINSYKVVQFEWLYADIATAMKRIKCWMMDLDNVECDKHISDTQNRQIFEKTGDKLNHIGNATVIHQRYPWYEHNIHQLFDPCYNTMRDIILIDRPQLLLGAWNTWNYTYK